MSSRSLFENLEAAGMVFLPAAIFFYAALAHGIDQQRYPLRGIRLRVFRAAIFAGIVAAVLVAADLIRYGVTREPVNTFWAVSNFAAISLWLFGLAGAFFGKHNGRILLIMAQSSTFLAALLLVMRTVTE